MPTSKSIEKIRVTFGDGSVTVVDPSSEHPIILLPDCGDDIAHVVSGKVSALVELYWAIGREYPGQGDFLFAYWHRQRARRRSSNTNCRHGISLSEQDSSLPCTAVSRPPRPVPRRYGRDHLIPHFPFSGVQ